MRPFYRDVPGVGNVRVVDHARQRAREQNISTEMFERVLLRPIKKDVPDGRKTVWRERGGVRIVIAFNQRNRPRVVTVYRVIAGSIAYRR